MLHRFLCMLLACTLSACALFGDQRGPAPADPVARFDKLVSDVTSAVKKWANAWESHDVQAYLAAYAKDFGPEEGTRPDWERVRRERVGRAGDLDIRLSELQVTSYAPDRATASFVQAYESPRHSEITRKVLELRLVNGRWLITREYAR